MEKKPNKKFRLESNLSDIFTYSILFTSLASKVSASFETRLVL